MKHFFNAKIVGSGISYENYSAQPIDVEASKAADAPAGDPIYVKRGDKRYIMSRGELVDFYACPMRWLNAPPEEPTTSLKYGSLLDILALTPEKFGDTYVIAPETYTNDKGEEKPWNMNANVCKDWMAKRSDMIIVKKADVDEAQIAVKRLLEDERITSFIGCSLKQVMVTADFKDEATGLMIPVRVLTDLAPDPKHPLYGKSLGDFKTSKDAAPSGWAREVGSYSYHVQAALNLDLHTAAAPDIERMEFRHLIQENSAPFQTGRRILSEEFIQLGRAKYLAALKLYAQCLHHNFWPDFETGSKVMNGWSLTEPRAWDVSQSFESDVNFPAKQPTKTEQSNDLIP